jgi:hypothetical protein
MRVGQEIYLALSLLVVEAVLVLLAGLARLPCLAMAAMASQPKLLGHRRTMLVGVGVVAVQVAQQRAVLAAGAMAHQNPQQLLRGKLIQAVAAGAAG